MHSALRQKLTHLPERLVKGLLRLSLARLMGVFVTLAVLIAVIIVLTIDLLWDGRLSAEMEVAGIVTSLIDASLVVGLMAMVLAALRAEVQHRERTEQVLKEAQRIAHIGNWTHDFVTHTLHWSDEIYRIFDIDPGQLEVSYETFLQRVHPEDRERVDGLYRQSLETKRPYEATHRLLMADGSAKYVFERGETVYDADGRALRTVGTIQDITERVRAEQELLRLATTDTLTGITNRHRFQEVLSQELERRRRYRVPLSLIMFDIDRFKEINDRHGHDVGDCVLVHVTRVVQTALRRSDVFARWGGEEFMILAPQTEAADAAHFAERLRTTVEQARWEAIHVTISLGVTYPMDDTPGDALLKCVDSAMYAAKAAGRNRVEVRECR